MDKIYLSKGTNTKDYQKRLDRDHKKTQRLLDRNIRKAVNQESRSGSFFSIFRIFVLLLIIISFSYFIRNGTYVDFSFQSLIERLADCPDVSLSFSNINLHIGGDWGFFDFFRGFLNQFTGAMEVMVTFTGFMVQMFVVLFYLLRLFFI